eukprot:353833-Chlamydomonas_euryale.AAC.4
MERFTQDGTVHTNWKGSHKMEGFTQDGTVHTRWKGAKGIRVFDTGGAGGGGRAQGRERVGEP